MAGEHGEDGKCGDRASGVNRVSEDGGKGFTIKGMRSTVAVATALMTGHAATLLIALKLKIFSLSF